MAQLSAKLESALSNAVVQNHDAHNQIEISQSYNRVLLVDEYRVVSAWFLAVDSAGIAFITITASISKTGLDATWPYFGETYKISFSREYIKEVSVITGVIGGPYEVIRLPPEWEQEAKISFHGKLHIRVVKENGGSIGNNIPTWGSV